MNKIDKKMIAQKNYIVQNNRIYIRKRMNIIAQKM